MVSYVWFQDGEWVRHMAACDTATTPNDIDTFAVYLRLPERLQNPTQDDPDMLPALAEIKESFYKEIRDNVAHGRAVIVQKWYPQVQTGFSIEDIGLIRPTTSHQVHWHGEYFICIA